MKYNWKNTAKNIGLFCTLFTTYFISLNTSVKAAETVVLRYGQWEESISVTDLESIAETGQVPQKYKVYTNKFPLEERQKFLKALQTGSRVNFVTLSRLLNTSVGSTILRDFARLTSRNDDAGMQALRAGLVLGAKTKERLSIISFIQNYPSDRLVINLAEALPVFNNLNLSYQQTNQFMQAINSRLAAKSTNQKLPFDPSEAGNGKVQVINLPKLRDEQRQRLVPIDIYWSDSLSPAKRVVILSHGFSSNRTDMRYIAEHLASHGFLVAALEHIGSNEKYKIDLTDLTKPKLTDMKPQEFLERPKDISFVLDELAKLNQTDKHTLQGKLTTDNAMVIGHSFGGGTALSIAGAELQVDSLKERCPQVLRATVSAGEGLQCIAKELPENRHQLHDSRIKQAIALNPTSSLMFGETGLEKVQVPTLILASSKDETTPALTEQIISFNKLPSPKWLIGIVGATHSSIKDPMSTAQTEEKKSIEVVGEQAADIRKYMKAITLAFASQMTPEANKYQVFLTPEYAQYVSTQAFPIRLVTEIPTDILKEINNAVSNNQQ
ncbi:alpha/beta hydrolase [Nostoc sphaeroides]|uniref:Alpha/beta hydrolase n=1 Tax=Nostoc sphaeroides CCNUC1 TaxID=2653204 RepID=A0A5P8WCD1_9NOSO|nr:alpha/beta hydrolase [Nostoc sphaeroides]QFS49589.1 alpha/beta hydrolase [Nostoc sphaeroides CCNUC1]